MNESLDNTSELSEEGLYPIRTVSEVTGVNAITLRAWERRYGLFKPQRTPKGHRLYSRHDILRIQQVLQLVEKGVAIGRVANALKSQTLVEDLGDLTMAKPKSKKQEAALLASELGNDKNKEIPTGDQWKTYHESLMASINGYDLAKLERLHHEVFSLYPLEVTANQLIHPALNELRKQADQLQSLSGNYHFYWHFLQQRIGGLFLKSTLQNRGKKLLLMAYGDPKADIELMLFGLPLLTHGYRVILLGSDIPFDAIPMTLSRANSDGLILFANNTVKDSADLGEMTEVISSVKAVATGLNMPFLVAGAGAKAHTQDLEEQGLIVLPEHSIEQFPIIDEQLA